MNFPSPPTPFSATYHPEGIADDETMDDNDAAATTWNDRHYNQYYNINIHDTVVEQEDDDEECAHIDERRSCCQMTQEECKTPEYQPPPPFAHQAYGTNSSATAATTNRSIQNPPLLRPKHPSLTHSHQPWNVPTSQEYEELSSRLKVHDAPVFPQSPVLSSQRSTQTASAVTTTGTSFWNRGAITTSFKNGPSYHHHHDETTTGTTSKPRPSQQPPPGHTRSASLPPQRRVFVSFQDCHFVRLPPRVSRSDGYVHDITWRVQPATTNESDTPWASSLSNDDCFPMMTMTSPDRKRTKTHPSTGNNEVTLFATPVKGYTIATAPTAATLFTQEIDDTAAATTSAAANNPQTDHHHKTIDADRLTYYRDKYYYDTDVVYAKSSLLYQSSSSQSNDSSREATPLPLLLDFDDDDDSESMSSGNESNEGRCCCSHQYSDSPTNHKNYHQSTSIVVTSTTATASTVPKHSTIGCGTSITTTTTTSNRSSSIASRAIPLKPPKLKMRTNHPLLVQNPNFAAVLVQPAP